MTRPNDKKLMLLDLGGVVFQSTGRSNDTIHWPVISRLNHQYGHALNVGEDRFPDFLRDYNRLTGQQLTGTAFLREVFDTLRINRELIDLVSTYGDVVIVSDNYRENIAYISQRYAFADWATHQIYSFDYGLVKTDPAFFGRLLEDFKPQSPTNMLLIDDSPDKLASALRWGIRGIHYQNNEQLREALEKLSW